MLKHCKKCKDCHGDLTISKALGVFQMVLVSEVDRFDSEDQGEICWMHRKLAAFQFIVDTLKGHGIYEEKSIFKE
ncbi:MAG: hypothetical protein J6S14_15515 [Clostridia bacterium]|nr:hypothetical protein [Clostridia bacterium]